VSRYAVFVLGGYATGLSVCVSMVGRGAITVIPPSVTGSRIDGGVSALSGGGDA
jgi:hypothetical protein